MTNYTIIHSTSGNKNTYLTGINDAGVIIGYSPDDLTRSSENGFTYKNGIFSSFSENFLPEGISSSGHIVGVTVTGFVHLTSNGALYKNGTFTSEGDPNTGAGGGFAAPFFNAYSIPLAINDHDQIVGTYDYARNSTTSQTTSRGYLHDGSVFLDLNDPQAVADTRPTGINNDGQIAGYFHDASGHDHGFVLTNGSFANIDDPLASQSGTHVTGINNRGDLVGTYYDVAGAIHGFYYTGGTFTTIDGPTGTTLQSINGINSSGQIVGVSKDNTGNTEGFVTGTNAHLSNSYRFFDTATGDHFYTLSVTEANQIRNTLPSYQDEGAQWSTPDPGSGTVDVFRFFDVATGAHFLTSSVAERNQVMATLPTYHYEGVSFEAYQATGPGTITLERFFNTHSNVHHYSTSASETAFIKNGGAGAGWVDEGAGFIVHPSDFSVHA